MKRLLFENKIKAQWVSVFPKEQLRNFDQRKKSYKRVEIYAIKLKTTIFKVRIQYTYIKQVSLECQNQIVNLLLRVHKMS